MESVTIDGGNKIKPIKPNSRVSKFIDAYIENGHVGSQAVLRAGYKQTNKNPSNTACYLLKRPEVQYEIATREAELLKSIKITKEEYTLLIHRELKSAKQETTRARLLQLLGDTLGHTKQEGTNTGNVTIFQTLDSASAFLTSYKQTGGAEEAKPHVDMPNAEIVESSPIVAQVNDIPHIDVDVSTSLSGEVIKLEPENRGTGEG
jgi:hypothetical protein